MTDTAAGIVSPGARSVQSRILGLLVAVAIGAIVVIGAAVYSFISHQERVLWTDRQREARRHAVESLTAFLGASEKLLRFAARISSREPSVAQEIMTQFVANHPTFTEVIRLDPDGRLLTRAHRDQAILANLFTLQQSLWFQKARTGRVFVGNPEITASGEPYLIMALPTEDGGVIAARIRAGTLWDVVRGLGFGRTGVTYLIDAGGRVIAHPEQSVVLAAATLKGRPEMTAILGAPTLRWEGTYRNLAGHEVQGASDAVGGSGWIVLSEITRAETSRSSRAALTLLNAIFLVFGALLLMLLARQLRHVVFLPLERLRHGAEIIGSGDLSHRMAVVRADEVGTVADAFNRMAARLSAREAELEEKARLLADEVAARTRVAEDLSRAKEAAEAASRAKSEFLARTSHEIRTPLHGVLGMTEVLLTTPLDERQRRLLETVQASGGMLLGILNDVLDLAKIEAGQMRIQRAEFDPAEILRRAVALHGARGREKGLRVSAVVDSLLPRTAIGDPGRVSQILGNLLDNAVKFTERGEIVAAVRKAPGTAAGPVLEFSVRDTGIGISPSQHREIFEDFTQADDFLTRRHGGTGLGLSIARRLTEVMGGCIRVESTPGEGSTFSVTIPFGEAPAAVVSPRPRTSAPAAAAPGLSHRVPEGALVLVAEDNEVNLAVLAQSLELIGCRHVVVRNGRSALAAASERSFDLILMDCQMPEMDGYEATRRIRAIERSVGSRRVPIVAVTGHALADEREKCLAAGMDDFLSKPFRIEQLQRMVALWTGGREARADLAQE